MFRSWNGLVHDLLISAVAAVILGAAVGIYQPSPFLRSWFSVSLLLLVALFLGIRTWRASSGSKRLAIILVVTFLSRLILGVVLHQLLPVAGYDTEVQNAGYVYSDAYNRDQEAYRLAVSSEPLFSAFSGKTGSDQYGGLLFISAAAYRLLSPDAIRPVLITILGSFVMSLGLIFLYAGIRTRWGERVALVAAWFYALYPEGILLGSSQMREPFLIGLFCIGFWAVLSLRNRVVYLILALVAAVLLSIPNGLAMAVILSIFVCVEWIAKQADQRLKTRGWVMLGALVLISAVMGWLWLKPSIYYDAYLTQQASGWIQKILAQIGEKWSIPFITFYGITQPLLPAAITDTALTIWKVIAITRSLGWYAVIPFLLFGFFELWREKDKRNKFALTVIVITLLVWFFVSSVRAGGDQWDNPRYRAILIPWLVIIVGWAYQRLKAGKGAWFYRWLGVELTFLCIFTYWYVDRYANLPVTLSFPMVTLLILIISFLIILAGFVKDKVLKRHHPDIE